jgi:hypothetical protein
MQAQRLWQVIARYEDEYGAELRAEEALSPRSFQDCEALVAELKDRPIWRDADLQIIPYIPDPKRCPDCGFLLPQHGPRCPTHGDSP